MLYRLFLNIYLGDNLRINKFSASAKKVKIEKQVDFKHYLYDNYLTQKTNEKRSN